MAATGSRPWEMGVLSRCGTVAPPIASSRACLIRHHQGVDLGGFPTYTHLHPARSPAGGCELALRHQHLPRPFRVSAHDPVGEVLANLGAANALGGCHLGDGDNVYADLPAHTSNVLERLHSRGGLGVAGFTVGFPPAAQLRRRDRHLLAHEDQPGEVGERVVDTDVVARPVALLTLAGDGDEQVVDVADVPGVPDTSGMPFNHGWECRLKSIIMTFAPPAISWATRDFTVSDLPPPDPAEIRTCGDSDSRSTVTGLPPRRDTDHGG